MKLYSCLNELIEKSPWWIVKYYSGWDGENQELYPSSGIALIAVIDNPSSGWKQITFLPNTGHSPNAASMLDQRMPHKIQCWVNAGQRSRRFASIETALGKRGGLTKPW